MKTRQGIEYWTVNDQYTIDGYDYFNTLSELEEDIDWQIESIHGRAFKDCAGWHRIAA